MRKITLAFFACGYFAIFSQSALATTQWQMHNESRPNYFEKIMGHSIHREVSSFDYSELYSDDREHHYGGFLSRLWSHKGHRINHFIRLHPRLEAWFDYKRSLWEEGHQPPPSTCAECEQPPVVPIPSTVWLLGSALGFIGWRSRKQLSQSIIYQYKLEFINNR